MFPAGIGMEDDVARANEAARLLANRQKEIDGAAMFRALGEAEKQPQMAEVYRKLAATEEHHAAAWEQRLSKLMPTFPPRKPPWRVRIMIWLALRFGTGFILPTSRAMNWRTARHIARSLRRRRPSSHRTRNLMRVFWQSPLNRVGASKRGALPDWRGVIGRAEETPCGPRCWVRTTV